MTARMLPGDRDGAVLIATDGVRFEVCLPKEQVVRDSIEYDMPDWATLYWFLRDDPRMRPDWNRTVGYKPEKFDKLSKSDN